MQKNYAPMHSRVYTNPEYISHMAEDCQRA